MLLVHVGNITFGGIRTFCPEKFPVKISMKFIRFYSLIIVKELQKKTNKQTNKSYKNA